MGKTEPKLTKMVVNQRGTMRIPPNNQAVANTIHCSPRTDSKVPLLKIKPAKHEHGEIKLIPI